MKKIPTINMKKTGERLTQLREEHGYSVSCIRDAVGLQSTQSVYKWERGENLPTIDNAVILAEIYGIPLDDLFVRDELKEAG